MQQKRFNVMFLLEQNFMVKNMSPEKKKNSTHHSTTNTLFVPFRI